jgi:hypothetical protein
MSMRPELRLLLPAAAVLLAACSTDARSTGGAGNADDAAVTDTGSTGDTGSAGDTGSPEDTAVDTGTPDAASDTGTPDTAGASVTWHRDIRPLVEAHCVECHAYGGNAPFTLGSYDEAADRGESIVSSVAEGTMPPWLPEAGCRPMQHARALTNDEKLAFEEWMTGGFAEGDPAEYVAPGPPDRIDLPAPTLQTSPAEGYAPRLTVDDDYRCQPLDLTFDSDTFITASTITPGDTRIVHHVLLYKVEPEAVDDLLAADAAEPGPGYTCFGGPGVGDGVTLGGWVPGQVPLVFPEGSALRIEAGSRIVMQLHYNTLTLADGEPAPIDLTSASLWTLPEGETPRSLVNIIPLAHTGIYIPAGDPASVQTEDFTTPIFGKIVGVLPHMHQLGTSIRMDILRPSGAEECLVSIPRWDFNWQQFYRFTDGSDAEIRPGDTLRLRCEYDNSAANQMVVNGLPREPRDVRWGEQTTDEMCLNYVIAETPYVPFEAGTCGGFETCVRACDDDDFACFIGCSAGSADDSCTGCVLGGLRPCLQTECAAQTLALGACLNRCQGDELGCTFGECATQTNAAYACLRPRLLAGACDEALADCDVAFASP